MNNIWGFLFQTLQVSLLAGSVLILKNIFKDKMPPLWQYSVWAVVAAAMVVPRGIGGIWLWKEAAVWIMAAKSTVESTLASNYTNRQAIVYNNNVLPFVKTAPGSITDILFVIYIAGIAFCIFKYLYTYIKLGKIIKKARINPDLQIKVKNVADKYNLKSCDVKELSGVPSAFVYGFFRPVMILPQDKETDEKVILHELLHLKYFDLQQKVVWSFFRALHWLNPFIQCVFGLINNDMESLRDNRVLHLLEGEERRDYGRILLSMTNEKYPSAFGTSSISNGSDFIGQRIESIARFKKYPKGMSVVSVCIILMLLPLTMAKDRGNEQFGYTSLVPYKNMDYKGNELPSFNYHLQREKVKMINVPTISAAMDIYVKACINNSEYALLPVNAENDNRDYLKPDYDKIKSADNLTVLLTDYKELTANRKTAKILYRYNDEIPVEKEESKANGKVTYENGVKVDNEDTVKRGTFNYIVPVEFIKQNGGWKVSQTDNCIYYYNDDVGYLSRIPQDKEYTGGLQKEIDTPYGTIKMQIDNIQKLNQYVENDFSWFMGNVESGSYYSLTQPDVNRVFNQVQTVVQAQFFPGETIKKHYKHTTALAILDDANDDFSFDIEMIQGNNSVGGDFDGAKYNINSFYADMLTGDDSYFNRVATTEVRSESTTTLPAKQPVVIIYELWLDNEKVYSFKYDVKAGVMIE